MTEGVPPQAPDSGQPGDPEVAGASAGGTGFGARGRVRRRVRFLRKARELAYRDLGGLVFNLHRFGQRNDELVLGKLTTLGNIDAELRTLETALRDRETVTVLREAGITACPRCAAIHSGDDRFCPNCGLSMGRHVELPITGTPAPGSPSTPPPGSTAPSAGTPGGSGSAGAATPGAPTGQARDGTNVADAGRTTPAEGDPPDATSGAKDAPARARTSPAEHDSPKPQPARPGRSPRPPAGPAADDPNTQVTAEHARDGEPTEITHPGEPEK